MHQGLCLLFDRLDDRRMAMAENIDRNAGEKIEILLAVSIPDFKAPALDQRQRVRA